MLWSAGGSLSLADLILEAHPYRKNMMTTRRAARKSKVIKKTNYFNILMSIQFQIK